MGMEAFAERARRELLATGETARTRTAGTTGAQLTAAGSSDRAVGPATALTNPEIGAQPFHQRQAQSSII